MNKYIKEAYKEALKSLAIDEVPVGAVIVKDNKIIARAYNKKENDNNPIGHAEILVIKKACKKLGSWRLSDCDIYTTLEPCTMCLGAIIHSRINCVYYCAIDNRFGAIEGAYELLKVGKFNHHLKSEYIKELECSKILSEYFKTKRKKSNQN